MPVKPHLHKGPDGKLPTASEVARARALEKIGLTLDWYNNRVEELRDVNGDPCCESCKQPEIKRLPGQKKVKDLVVSRDKESVKLLCASCAQKQYKQSMKERSAMRQDIDGASSLESFWQRNRNKLSEPQVAQMEERHIDTILLGEEAELVIQAFQENLPFVESGLHGFIREVCQDVLNHGFILPDIAIVPFYKPEHADFYNEWTSGEHGALEYRKAMPAYMQFGYYHALPEYTVHRFFDQVERYFGLPGGFVPTNVRIQRILDALEGRIYRTPDKVISCTTPRCEVTKTVGPNEKTPAEWFCPACDAERTARGHAVLRTLFEKRKDSRLARQVREAEDRAALYGEDGRYNG